MNSFLRWPGGKKSLKKEIAKRIPYHQCYVEPFGGAAWVLFVKNQSPVEVYNDIDGRLVSLFNCAKYHFKELQKEINFFLGSRKLFYEIKAQPGLTEIQRAARFYFLNHLSFGGMNKNFSYNKLHGGAADISKKNLIKNLEKVYQRLDKVIIENLDYHQCIQKYDGPLSFFYCDPPYIKAKQNYYLFNFDLKDHEKLVKLLRTIKGKFLVTLDNCKEAKDLYQGFKITKIKRSNFLNKANSKRKILEQLLIRNYALK